jgi:hypothetical protein
VSILVASSELVIENIERRQVRELDQFRLKLLCSLLWWFESKLVGLEKGDDDGRTTNEVRR